VFKGSYALISHSLVGLMTIGHGFDDIYFSLHAQNIGNIIFNAQIKIYKIIVIFHFPYSISSPSLIFKLHTNIKLNIIDIIRRNNKTPIYEM
jgi:hypothetical protein